MANPALISKDIVDLQDIEKIQFLQSLQADPAKYSAYVADKQNRILAEVADTKRASFTKASADMARMMDMDFNSQVALNRTNDLIKTQQQIINGQSELYNSKKRNMDMTRRQAEINNWYYENKRETLFVLQLLLLVVLALVVSVALRYAGYTTEMGTNFFMGFVIIVGASTWLYRYYYTANIRDPRYWNKRKFSEDKPGPNLGDICASYGGSGASSQDTISSEISSGVASLVGGFNSFQSGAANMMALSR